MDLFLKTLEIVLAALYVGSAITYALDFSRSTKLTAMLCRILLRATLVLHLILFAIISAYLGRNPVANFFEFFSAFALGLLLIYSYLEFKFQNRSLGPPVLTFAAVAQVVASVLAKHPRGDEVNQVILTIWFTFHQVFVTLAFSSLVISAIFSVMYLVLHRSLKRKVFDIFFDKFLPLATLGEMNYQAMVLGVIFLAANIPVTLGMVFAFNAGEWDIQYCMFFTYFIVYAVGGALGKKLGWRGNRLAIYSLSALLVLIVATGAAKFLSERHSWF